MPRFDTIPEAIEEIRAGRLVMIADDKDRENEGDFIGAACQATPEMINFMLTYARGAYIAVFMPTGRCAELAIPPMCRDNRSFNRTNFHVAVDAVGATSGSSASDRALVVNFLADPKATAEQFVRPGHVVPIEAHPGGLRARRGHTEAGVELIRLAGVEPSVAVDLEILDEDGSMAGERRLFELRDRFGLKIIRVADLLAHLIEQEQPAKLKG